MMVVYSPTVLPCSSQTESKDKFEKDHGERGETGVKSENEREKQIVTSGQKMMVHGVSARLWDFLGGESERECWKIKYLGLRWPKIVQEVIGVDLRKMTGAPGKEATSESKEGERVFNKAST